MATTIVTQGVSVTGGGLKRPWFVVPKVVDGKNFVALKMRTAGLVYYITGRSLNARKPANSLTCSFWKTLSQLRYEACDAAVHGDPTEVPDKRRKLCKSDGVEHPVVNVVVPDLGVPGGESRTIRMLFAHERGLRDESIELLAETLEYVRVAVLQSKTESGPPRRVRAERVTSGVKGVFFCYRRKQMWKLVAQASGDKKNRYVKARVDCAESDPAFDDLCAAAVSEIVDLT